MKFPKPIRLPREAYADPGRMFHIVIRAAIQTKPFADRSLAQAVWNQLTDECGHGQIVLAAACLMPDHLHLLARREGLDLVTWANRFKSRTTNLSWTFGWRGALWQPSFYDRYVRDHSEFESVRSYIVRNPVEAGLVTTPEAWPWLSVWDDE